MSDSFSIMSDSFTLPGANFVAGYVPVSNYGPTHLSGVIL